MSYLERNGSWERERRMKIGAHYAELCEVCSPPLFGSGPPVGDYYAPRPIPAEGTPMKDWKRNPA